MKFLKNLNKTQKACIYAALCLIVVVATISVFFLSRSNWVTVIANVNSKELKAITNTLDSNGIKYKYNSTSNNIMVDKKDKNKADLELTMAGLPKGNHTFDDAFGMINIKSTESDKEKIWDNYKKNRMVSLIKMIDNVQDADVEVSMPRDKTLNKPSAIVTITPKKGVLSSAQVNAIKMIVSRSVVGLEPESVVVVDNKGNVLNLSQTKIPKSSSVN